MTFAAKQEVILAGGHLLLACHCQTCDHPQDRHQTGPCIHCDCTTYVDNGESVRLLNELMTKGN